MSNAVFISNELLPSYLALYPIERDIIDAALCKLDATTTEKQITNMTINTDDVENIAAYTQYRTMNIRDLIQTCQELSRQQTIIKSDTTNSFYNWFKSIHINHKQAEVTLNFNDEILPHITKLSNKFTVREVEHFNKLKHPYSRPLYALLTQQLKAGQLKISIEELRDYLNLEDKYQRMDRLNADVIKPALQEINKYSDLKVPEPRQRKSGNRIIAFIFQIKRRPKAKPTATNNMQPLISGSTSKAKVGESMSDYLRRLKHA